MIKAMEFREMAEDALHGKIQELELSLFNLRFQASMGKLENHSQLRTARREIARAKTLLGQRTISKAPAAAAVKTGA